MWTVKQCLPIVIFLVCKMVTEIEGGGGMGITYPGKCHL